MFDRDHYWIFLIDTDTYAGNFEREMTAWCTGTIGDCGKGYKEKKIFEEDMKDSVWAGGGRDSLFSEQLLYKAPDEYGCARPCIIFKDSNGEDYNSVGILFFKKPERDAIDVIIGRSASFPGVVESEIKIQGFRLLERQLQVIDVEHPLD